MIEFNLKKGLKGIAQTTVNEENSAERFAKPMVPAFATPMLVSLMDLAAINAVKKNLPEGYISVASKISITHLAVTPLGMTVTADSTLVDIFQNRLTFQVNAFDEVGEDRGRDCRKIYYRFREIYQKNVGKEKTTRG